MGTEETIHVKLKTQVYCLHMSQPLLLCHWNVSEINFRYYTFTVVYSLVELEVSLVVMNNTDSVEMRCEMSQYIEPDDNLQWFRNGHMINASNSKYQIQFEDGSTPSLINGVRTESRISVLVISDFNQQNDSGCYHCMAINSQKSASIYVSLEEPGK